MHYLAANVYRTSNTKYGSCHTWVYTPVFALQMVFKRCFVVMFCDSCRNVTSKAFSILSRCFVYKLTFLASTSHHWTSNKSSRLLARRVLTTGPDSSRVVTSSQQFVISDIHQFYFRKAWIFTSGKIFD